MQFGAALKLQDQCHVDESHLRELKQEAQVLHEELQGLMSRMQCVHDALQGFADSFRNLVKEHLKTDDHKNDFFLMKHGELCFGEHVFEGIFEAMIGIKKGLGSNFFTYFFLEEVDTRASDRVEGVGTKFIEVFDHKRTP